MKRKGSFLRRHFATLRGPLVDDDGNPTRLALQAQAWGEKVPKTEEDAQKLAEKGSKLLEKYKKMQAEEGGEEKPAKAKPAAKKKAPAKAKPAAKAKATKKED